jgi:4-hydroxy-2-oxoheptanedioate aldolase
MRRNEVKAKLSAASIVFGSFIYIPSPKLTELVAQSGFDFVVIDMEHGPIDSQVAEDMIRAAELGGIASFVRVPCNSAPLIMRALDAGAAGVHVPNVDSGDAGRAAASTCRYGPAGTRGLASVRAANYGLTEPLEEYAAAANREVMLIAHIESIKAIENLDELLDVDGIDVYFLGAADLSNSLGIPGRVRDPKVIRLVENAIMKIAKTGKVAGAMAADVSMARHYIELGAKYVTLHPVQLMVNASRAFLSEARSSAPSAESSRKKS